MRKRIVLLVSVGSLITALEMSAPAEAGMGQNSIGLSFLSSGTGSSVGIDSKFGISNNLSLRPFAYFPSNNDRGAPKIFGSAITYDFNFKTRDGVSISPFLGSFVSAASNGSSTAIGLVGGADFPVSDSLDLKASLRVPLNNASDQNAGVTIGAGFRF